MLSQAERRIVDAIADVASPPGARLRSVASESGVSGGVAELLAAMGRDRARFVRMFLWLLELWPLFTRGRRLSSLEPGARLHALEAWHGSRLLLRRSVVRAVLGLVQVVRWSTPEASAALGWKPGPRSVAPVTRFTQFP